MQLLSIIGNVSQKFATELDGANAVI